MHRQIAALFLMLSLVGCGKGISVQNQYFSREDLASFKMRTPDPLRNCPPIGQRLIVQWNYPAEILELEDPHLLMTIRLRDYSEERIVISICKRKGTYIYELVNQRYFDTCGIMTYKIETWGCGKPIDVWKHQLWTELITIDQENDAQSIESKFEAIDFIDPENNAPSIESEFEHIDFID